MKPIYLESDEEITSVIDKIRAAGDGSLALVVAKNSPIAQSLVNLKLIAKEADTQKKEVCLITSNRISIKLAGRVGLKAYASLGGVNTSSVAPKSDLKKEPEEPKDITTEAGEDERLPDGTLVNQYRPDRTNKPEENTEPVKELLEEKAGESKSFEPITVAAADVEKEPLKVAEDNEEVSTSQVESEPEPTEPEKVSSPKIDESPELPSVVSRTISVTPTIRREFHFPWKSAIIALIILVVGSLLAMIFVPRATVTATLPATFTEGVTSLNVKTATDSLEKTIGGNLLTASKSAEKTITATGKKDIGTKAAGNITLYNKASSSAVTLPTGTVLTSGGKSFALDKSASIPGASVSGGSVVPGQVSAAITASAAGTDSNLTSAQFAITGQPSLVYGSGSTTGGSTKQVTVLSQEDVDKAMTELRTQVQTEAKAEMESKSEGQLVVNEAIWESSKKEEVDKAVGAQVDSATAKASYELSAMAFDKAAAEQKLIDKLGKDLDASKEFRVNEDASPSIVFKSYSEDHSVLNIDVSGSGYIVTKVDKAKMATDMKNLSVSAAKQKVIDTYGAESVEISISPNWWFGRLPLLKNQIKAEFGYSVATPTQ